MDYILAMDTSYYQDNNRTPIRPDFKKAYAAGVRISLHRACFSTTKDEDFDYNWPAAADAGLLRCAYGFVDWRTGAPKAADQGKKFTEILHKDPGEIPTQFGDFERPNKYWPNLPAQNTCISILTDYFREVDTGLGRMTGLYGNQETIKALQPIPAKTLERPLWVAGWPIVPEGIEPEAYCLNRKPTYWPWKSWTFWQFTAKGDGLKYGMESLSVDLDYYNGTMEQLLAWCGKKPEPSLEEKVHILWLAYLQK